MTGAQEQERAGREPWEAGAALDAEIDRVVFGNEIRCSHGIFCSDIPPYSDDMSTAWLVVERMRERGYVASLHVIVGATPFGCGFWSGALSVHKRDGHYVDAETMPLAICRAALLTLRTDAEQKRAWEAQRERERAAIAALGRLGTAGE